MMQDQPNSPRHQRDPRILLVSLWVYQRLLALYPATFRCAFGQEIMRVARQTYLATYHSGGCAAVVRIWIPSLAELLYGALAEYTALLFPHQKGAPLMARYRQSASAVFAAYIAFVLVGMGFAKMSEDVMKSSLPATYPLFTIGYDVIAVLAVISLLAVLVGGLPVALAALRYAWEHRRRDILARFAVPPVALLLIFAYVLIVTTLHPRNSIFATNIHLVGIGFVVLFVAGAIASTYAVITALANSEIPLPMFRFTLLAGVVATAAMLGMAIAALLWILNLWSAAPTIFWGNDGLLASSTVLSAVGQLFVMAVAIAVAMTALWRGFGRGDQALAA